jgi:hypothetical protein
VSRKNFSCRRSCGARVFDRACGARTRACRVHTRVNAWIGARPSVILNSCNQPGSNRIWRHQRQQEHVNVIRHQNEWPQRIVSQGLAAIERIDDERCHCFLLEKGGAGAGCVERPVNPAESVASGDFGRRRKVRRWHSAVQTPGEEEPAAFGVDVGEAAPGDHVRYRSPSRRTFSRLRECERSTQECVRHDCHRRVRRHAGARQ